MNTSPTADGKRARAYPGTACALAGSHEAEGSPPPRPWHPIPTHVQHATRNAHTPSPSPCPPASRPPLRYFNVLNDEGRSVVGALLVWDAAARMPETLPEDNGPLWDRPGLASTGGKI